MLSGKLAVITGSGSGVGLEIAKQFAKEGAALILVDINKDTLNDALKEINREHRQQLEHVAHCCDISKKDDVIKLFKEIKNKYQKAPNVIVNCAGLYIPSYFHETSEADYDSMMNVNLKGTFLVSQEAVKELIDNYKHVKLGNLDTYASIINVSSIVAKQSIEKGAVYVATKAGAIGMSNCMARELAKYKIRCNSVLSGITDTPLSLNALSDDERKYYTHLSPMKRIGQAVEIANVCLFLASDKSSFVTGAQVECSGGMFC